MMILGALCTGAVTPGEWMEELACRVAVKKTEGNGGRKEPARAGSKEKGENV